MEQREKLIELLKNEPISLNRIAEKRADYLLANGVVVLPCRCKECYYNDNGSCDEIIWCNFHDTTMGANDFCKHAKRKDDIVDLCTTGHLHLGYLEEKGGGE